MNKKQLIECEEVLKLKGLLGYGVTIPKESLEDVLSLKYSDSWDWRGPVLELRSHLTDIGYFISERGVEEGAIRFLSECEIPDALEKRRTKRYFHMARDINVAKRLPLTHLGTIHQSKLHYERDRLGRDLSSLTDNDPALRSLIVNG